MWGWIKQWWYWDARPTAAQYRAACDDRDHYAARVRKLQVLLAESRAEADSAEAEVLALAAVVKRNQERVDAEAAQAASERERALTEVMSARIARKGE